MTWYNRLPLRSKPQRQSEYERLIQLAGIGLGVPLTPAEVQVLKVTTSSQALPSADDPYPDSTPRPDVRAAFVTWLATDLEARPLIHAKGIRIYSSTIIGDLDLGAQSQVPALDFRRCTLTGKITLEFSATKGINITDCCITGGIEADGVVVHGALILQRTVFDTEIRFINGIIESNLECQGAKLKGEPDSITLDGATVKGDVFFSEHFESSGEIRMLGTTVVGALHCTGARLLGSNYALSLDKANISGNVNLNRNLYCTGMIRLHNCTIAGNLIFFGATVNEVICWNMKLSGDLVWCGVRKTPKTLLDLNGAHVKTFRDDEASQLAKGQLELVNFVYTDLIFHEDPLQEHLDKGKLAPERALKIERDRIPWLKRQPDLKQLHPQPWVQMGKYLESFNNKEGSSRVRYEYRRLMAQKGEWYYRVQRIVIAWLEASPLRVIFLIVVTLALGTLIFTGASCSDAMISTARDKDGQPLTGAALVHYPPFQPFVYTFENALPLVKLGVDDKWTPDPNHKGRPWFPRYPCLNWLGWFNSYCFLAASRQALILLGWFQAAVFGLALTSRFKS